MLKNGPEHKALADVSSELNLSQIIKSPTRITDTCQSLIDIILVSSPLRYIGVLDTPIIDHLPVYALLNYKRPKTSPSNITARSYKNDPLSFASNLAGNSGRILSIFSDGDVNTN